MHIRRGNAYLAVEIVCFGGCASIKLRKNTIRNVVQGHVLQKRSHEKDGNKHKDGTHNYTGNEPADVTQEFSPDVSFQKSYEL